MASNETVAEIVERMRATGRFHDGVFCNLADRVEAAHKRELAVKNAEIAKLRTLTTHTDNSEVIAELQRRLKEAEDALKAAIGTSCAGCKQDCDRCLNLKNGWMKDAKKALATIRGKRGTYE